jgi:hypothetical protein
MRKAHLFEALFLVNRGIDEAVCGVQRLKKAPGMFMESYDESLAELEWRRALVNMQFITDVRKREEADVTRFENEYDLYASGGPLDHDEICKLMRIVEDERQAQGKPPMVQFLEAAPPLEEPPGDPPAPTAG